MLEPEVMDTPDEARDYDAMDHAAVNRAFAEDFLNTWTGRNPVLDVGTGTAQIPIVICRLSPLAQVVAIDLADHMIELARRNVERAGLAGRIRLERVNARQMPYPDGAFPAVVSNSIVHHIPDPAVAFEEMHRVCAPGGVLFVRDLLRPDDETTLVRLVKTYAGDANDHQRKMFADSLRAALTLVEVQDFVGALGYPPETVTATSDRHWTWATVKV